MRRVAVVLQVLFVALPLVSVGAQAEGAVDRAKAWNVSLSCDDGIGMSATSHQQQAAADKSQVDEVDYALNVTACGAVHNAFSLIAECSAPVEGVDEGTALIYCLVFVGSNLDVQWKDIFVAAKDFSLLSNTESYPVDLDLSKQVDPQYDIVSEPTKLRMKDNKTGVLVFKVPSEVAKDDMVLQWSGADEVHTDKGVLPGLQIIVHDREPGLAELIAASASDAPAASTGVGQSAEAMTYSGMSDDVIGPITFAPGLYRVSARYTGDDNFAVWTHQADGTDDLLFNEIGSYRGEATFTVEASTKVVLEVKGVGAWELRIERLM